MQQPRLWHSFDKDSVCRTLDTSPAGLLPAEAQSRLSHYGLNRLPQARKRRWYVRLAGHIHNALIYIMLVASVITFLMGHVVDSFVIGLVIVVNTIIGYIQVSRPL